MYLFWGWAAGNKQVAFIYICLLPGYYKMNSLLIMNPFCLTFCRTSAMEPANLGLKSLKMWVQTNFLPVDCFSQVVCHIDKKWQIALRMVLTYKWTLPWWRLSLSLACHLSSIPSPPEIKCWLDVKKASFCPSPCPSCLSDVQREPLFLFLYYNLTSLVELSEEYPWKYVTFFLPPPFWEFFVCLFVCFLTWICTGLTGTITITVNSYIQWFCCTCSVAVTHHLWLSQSCYFFFHEDCWTLSGKCVTCSHLLEISTLVFLILSTLTSWGLC